MQFIALVLCIYICGTGVKFRRENPVSPSKPFPLYISIPSSGDIQDNEGCTVGKLVKRDVSPQKTYL